MSLLRSVSVICDHLECEVRATLDCTEERPVPLVVLARDDAKNHGWTRDGPLDLCPRHRV